MGSTEVEPVWDGELSGADGRMEGMVDARADGADGRDGGDGGDGGDDTLIELPASVVRRLTPKERALRVAGAVLAVVVGLGVLLTQLGVVDLGAQANALAQRLQQPTPAPATTIERLTVAARPPALVAGTPWERISFPVPGEQVRFYLPAPGDAQTIYACSGAPLVNGAPPLGTISFWSTHDAGTHWTRPAMPLVRGRTCAISVAPDAPNQIAMLAIEEFGPQFACVSLTLLLSRDNGESWRRAPSLPTAPSTKRSCAPAVWLTARHLWVSYFYDEGTDRLLLNPFAKLLRSDDGGVSWRTIVVDRDPRAVSVAFPLADGENVLAASPTIGTQGSQSGTSLWASHTAGASWTRLTRLVGYGSITLVTALGARDPEPNPARPVYALENEGALGLDFHLRIAEVRDAAHWSLLPALPVTGASQARLGVTTVLGATATGQLLALGVGPAERVPAESQPVPVELRVRQWLWVWDPTARRWSALGPALPQPWPDGCETACFRGNLSQARAGGAALTLWVGNMGTQGTGAGVLYRQALVGDD